MTDVRGGCWACGWHCWFCERNSGRSRLHTPFSPLPLVQYWVSQSNYWCEYCKVWLKDTVQSRATHEKGVKHQENVAKRAFADWGVGFVGLCSTVWCAGGEEAGDGLQGQRGSARRLPFNTWPPVPLAPGLRDMRRKAGEEKEAAEQMSKTMKAIESTAAEQYARDQAEAARQKAETLGEWVRRRGRLQGLWRLIERAAVGVGLWQ